MTIQEEICIAAGLADETKDFGPLESLIEHSIASLKEDALLQEDDGNLMGTLMVLNTNYRVDLAKKLIDKIDVENLSDSQCYDMMNAMISVRDISGKKQGSNIVGAIIDEEGNNHASVTILQHMVNKPGFKFSGTSQGKDAITLASEQMKSPAAKERKSIAPTKKELMIDKALVRTLILTKKIVGFEGGLADLAMFMLEEGEVEGIDFKNQDKFFIPKHSESASNLKNSFNNDKNWMIRILRNYQNAKPEASLDDILTKLQEKHNIIINASEFEVTAQQMNQIADTSSNSVPDPTLDKQTATKIKGSQKGSSTCVIS